ncbi:hypothetical protein [Facklamia sp. P12934]|uniref:hypothetical protein n=1 Tax=unclassified Facklamia TaxID=2622293 RepID=UPI003D180905
MVNFIRFDSYKLLHMKATWITLLILSLIFSLLTYGGYVTTHKSYEDYQLSMTSKETNEEGNFKLEIKSMQEGEILTEEEYETSIQEEKKAYRFSDSLIANYSLSLLFVYILSAVFIESDFSSGYLKNMLAIKGAKWKWMTSKLFVALLIFFIFQVVCIAFSVLMAGVTGQLELPIYWQDHLALLLPQALMYLIIMSVTVTLSLLLQSKAAIIVLACLVGTGFHNQIIGFIGDIVGLDLTKQLFSNKLMSMGPNYSEQAMSVVSMGVVYLLVLYLLNRWYIYRIDFKFEH